MLSSGNFEPGEDGTYFVDRSPEYFGRILDYMRHDELILDGLEPYQVRKVWQFQKIAMIYLKNFFFMQQCYPYLLIYF